MILAHLTMAAAVLLGWTEITVQPSRGERSGSAYHRNLANLDRPSERTLETIKRYDLERQYRRGLDALIPSLVRLARERPEGELVYALAELSWVEGRRLDRWRRAAAIDRFVDAVAYAHDFLTDPELADPNRGSDPRYRTAMELYNGGLERLIRAAQSNGQLMPEGAIRLKAHGREQVFRVALRNSPWTPDDVDKLILASDYEVHGLPTRTYQFGLGVPLIGVRLSDGQAREETKFYPTEMAFPLTALLRPNSRLRDPGTDPDRPRECSLELIDPLRSRDYIISPTLRIPIEADFTTPLAYMWSKTDLNHYRWTGLLRPGEAIDRANLMLLRPYEPGKIPVVMVHGLISSPLAWIPMINELLRDPQVQDRYQFLLYVYPTGVPIPIAAAMLRDSLRQAERMYNANGSDPAFSQMVLLGHSMGGLLSHFMVVDSGPRLWQLNTDRPFREIQGPRKVLDELQGYFFFQPLPFVKEVVFLATPHRGSEMSRGVVGRVGAGLISEPDHISDLLTQLVKDNPDAFDRRRFRRLPSSIETLEPITPNNPSILNSLLEMKPEPTVTFHSIIGSLRPGGVAQSTDGVVPYWSAHLTDVESELLVRSDHGVQKAPAAILEVQRILRKHAAAVAGQPQRTALSAPGQVR